MLKQENRIGQLELAVIVHVGRLQASRLFSATEEPIQKEANQFLDRYDADMKTSSKRVVVHVLLAFSTAAVVAAGFCSWEPLLEHWYLWKLDSTDEQERKSAAHRLGQMRSMRAVPILLKLAVPELEEAAEEWRTELPYAAKVVVDMGPDVVPTLMGRLRATTESPEVRRAATHVLSAMKIPATAPLITALGDEDPQIRVYALGALMGMPSFMTDLLGRVQRPTDQRALRDVVTAVCERFRDRHAEIRMYVATHFFDSFDARSKSVVLAYSKLLEDDSAPVVLAALESLRRYRSSAGPAVPAVVRALSHDRVDVRLAAANALRDLGRSDGVAVPALAEALKERTTVEPEESVRDAIATALSRIQRRTRF